MKTTDLNVATPEEVSAVLRNAAEQYRESIGDLQSAWQDQSAGRPWERLAKALEACANSIERHNLTRP